MKYIRYMKLIREHINEKFQEESDPIEDLGIGSKYIYDNLKQGDMLRVKKSFMAGGKLTPVNIKESAIIRISDISRDFPIKDKTTISFEYEVPNKNYFCMSGIHFNFNFFVKHFEIV
jgi:hypothetical protein